MATLQASKVLEALNRAKQVGRVEIPVTIDGCSIVLQNLTTSDYNDIHAETEDLDEVAYLYGFQEGHICRAIVEIGDQDLRDVQFIEEEVPSGAYVVEAQLPNKKAAEAIVEEVRKRSGEAGLIPPSGEPRSVRLERHTWIKEHLLPGWGREAVAVAWKKFAEVLDMADEKAREGVTFKIPDETAEEKFRRILSELKEAEEDLPPEMVSAIYNEVGFFKSSSKEEFDRVTSRLQNVQVAPQATESLPVAPEPPVRQKAPEPAPEPVQRASSDPTPEELMRTRMPLNRRPVTVSRPVQDEAVPAAKKVEVPEHIRKAAAENASSMRGRSAAIANLESQVDPGILDETGMYDPHGGEVAVLSEPIKSVDGRGARTIIGTPPRVGINTRFKPPQG